jgi:DNA-binding response OmpR family regulator
MSLINILIIEDEDRMRRLITDYLRREGYNTIEAEDGRKALEIFQSNKIDLIILDIMLPEYDGWTVLREIRKISDTAVIILTARGEEADQLFGFELGADEYVTKPFSPKVLVARVKALLKRSGIEGYNSTIVIDDIIIDETAHKVFIKGKELELTPKEYELFIYMAKNKGRALSREKILSEIWGYDYYGDSRTVDTHIKRLRMKLKEKSYIIQTVRGVGYRFEVGY